MMILVVVGVTMTEAAVVVVVVVVMVNVAVVAVNSLDESLPASTFTLHNSSRCIFLYPGLDY